ncbi:MAG TPA: NADP-dependent oxidoreductase [Candidatus Paceibacterota bacterium]|nr:NADP-dependent oxidoreductase [Candidatus Paceibacterota bacterium]
MKAAQIKGYGGSDVIEIINDAPKPIAQPGQVLVEVHAASLNRIDVITRAGFMHQMMPLTFPATLGGDFAGIVSEVGEGVTDVQVGDEVYGQAGGLMGGSGSLAEFTATQASKVAKKPASIDMTQAASLPLVGASAIQGIEEHINVQHGQKVLIHGGMGGIGSLAIQIAKMHDAYVATTVSTEEMEVAKELGADEVIDYKTQDFTSIVKDYDAVFVTAQPTLNDSLKVLKKGGILVSMVGPVEESMVKEYDVTIIPQMTQVSAAQLARLTELVDTGSVKPVVDKAFTLGEVKGAFDYFEQQHPKGKVVVTVK